MDALNAPIAPPAATLVALARASALESMYQSAAKGVRPRTCTQRAPGLTARHAHERLDAASSKLLAAGHACNLASRTMPEQPVSAGGHLVAPLQHTHSVVHAEVVWALLHGNLMPSQAKRSKSWAAAII